MYHSKRFFIAIGTTLCALTALACTDKPEPKYPAGSGGQAALTTTSTGAGGATPNPSSAASGGAGSYATPIPPLLTANAGPILRGLAQNEVAGMRSDGPPMAAQFQPGQIYEQAIQLIPGRCYAILGVGIGITELDLELVIHQAPAPEYIAARDETTGPQAILGGRKNCFKNPLPFPTSAKLRMRATGGAGLAMAQVFSR